MPLTDAQRDRMSANRQAALAKRAARAREPSVPEPAPAETLATPQGHPPGQPPPSRDDRPTCIICMCPMLPAEATTALVCGHVYHEYCIDEYAQVKGLERDRACPIRCRNPVVTVVEDEEEPAPAGQGGDPSNAASGELGDQMGEDIEALLEQTLAEANAL